MVIHVLKAFHFYAVPGHCAGCGNVNLMGVSISGESLYRIVRFMYCSMEICTFLNIHGNSCFKSFPFLGRTRSAVLVVGM